MSNELIATIIFTVWFGVALIAGMITVFWVTYTGIKLTPHYKKDQMVVLIGFWPLTIPTLVIGWVVYMIMKLVIKFAKYMRKRRIKR